MTFAVTPTTLRAPAALAGWRRRPGATPPRFAVVLATSGGVGGERTPPTFARLREELLQLHAEADLTQSKANSARVRLVRLTEAAENLKKRAATSVRMGKENEAVDLLVQKKKLTKVLENIKERIEVLDRLSAKISEMKSLEYEIEQFISSQSVEEVGSEKQRSAKWQRLSDIQMLVKETREKIARILGMTVEEAESGDLR